MRIPIMASHNTITIIIFTKWCESSTNITFCYIKNISNTTHLSNARGNCMSGSKSDIKEK